MIVLHLKAANYHRIFDTCSFAKASSMLPLRKSSRIKPIIQRQIGKRDNRKKQGAETNFCVLVFVEEITISPSLLMRFFSCSHGEKQIEKRLHDYCQGIFIIAYMLYIYVCVRCGSSSVKHTTLLFFSCLFSSIHHFCFFFLYTSGIIIQGILLLKP